MSQLSLSGRIVEQLELNENFSSQRKRFLAAGADSQLIDAAFQRFKRLKDKGLLSLEQKDIDRYKSLEELQQVLSSLSTVKTKTQQKKEQKVAGAELVYENAEYRVYHITTYEASRLYGKGTKWCISGNSRQAFYDYSAKDSVYFVIPRSDDSADKYAVLQGAKRRRVYNSEDKIVRYKKGMFGVPLEVFSFKADDMPDPKEGQVHSLLHYAENVIKRRWPEAEERILSTPFLARVYARDVIKGRWPELEAIIVNSADDAYEYAKHTLKRRWPEAEPAIMTDPLVAKYYAIEVIKGRWPEAEPAILSSNSVNMPSVAMNYAWNILQRRWPEAEPKIAADPYAAVMYADNVIKGRWPEAERAIRGSKYAGSYARSFLPGGKWPEEQA